MWYYQKAVYNAWSNYFIFSFNTFETHFFVHYTSKKSREKLPCQISRSLVSKPIFFLMNNSSLPTRSWHQSLYCWIYHFLLEVISRSQLPHSKILNYCFIRRLLQMTGIWLCIVCVWVSTPLKNTTSLFLAKSTPFKSENCSSPSLLLGNSPPHIELGYFRKPPIY